MENKNLYTSNFSTLKKVALKLGLFMIPVFLVFLFPLLILYSSGELLGVYNQEEKEVFGLSYSYPVKFYKTKNTNTKKPEVLVLGSSRAMQFEQKLFNKEYSFYNAGGAINALENFNLFWKNLKNKPDYIVITVDPWWFNETYDNLNKNYFAVDFERPGNPIKVFINQWKTVYDDLIAGKISLTKIFKNKDKVGLLAIMKNEGFLSDGSYQYSSDKYLQETEEKMKGYKKQALNKKDRFQVCEKINSKALDKFDNFVNTVSKEIKKENIFIIHPPMAKEILDVIPKEENANYYYLNDSLSQRMSKIGLSENYLFSDRTENEGMLDGIHPLTETIDKDLKDFASRNEALKQILSKQ